MPRKAATPASSPAATRKAPKKKTAPRKRNAPAATKALRNTPGEKPAPAIQMLPYQQRWIDDKAKRKIANKARQIGFSFASMYEAVEDCLSPGPMVPWFYLSVGERQAREALMEGQKHAAAFKAATEIIAEDFLWEGERIAALTLQLPTKRRIVGLPANPATARGASGHVILDEFAHHKDARVIYKSVFPFTTRGYKLRVQSTPAGKQGKFYEVWTHGKGWSRHEVDIYQAVAQGLKTDIDDLRAGIGNEDDWQQEYCCAFVDEAHAWIPFDLIDAAEDDAATLDLPEDLTPVGALYLGVDIGRKRDLTVLYLLELLGDVRWTRAMIELEKAPFRHQIETIEALLPMVVRCCIDATGMGMPIAEELQERWGTRVEPVTFTATVKEELATRLRALYEDRRIRIPKDQALRQDIHSVRRLITVAGNTRFDADRSDAGHADRFWAQGLAVHAGDEVAVVPRVDRVQRSEAAELFGQTVGRFFDDDEDEAWGVAL